MGWKLHRCLSSLAALALVGCQNPERSYFGDNRVNEAAPVQIVDASFEPFTPRRLADLIVSAGSRNPAPSPGDGTSKLDVTAMDTAIAQFGNALGDQPSREAQMTLRRRRNEVQGILLAASSNRCNVYKVHLRRLSSTGSFLLGSSATALGGVGALFTDGTAAVLSALSGITSGVNSEFKQDFMSNLTTTVIIPGIEKQRSAIMGEIAKRRCLGVSSYPLSAAIADAIRFHGACTADMGIAAAGQAVGQTTMPNAETVLQSAAKIMQAGEELRRVIAKKSQEAKPENVQPKNGQTPAAKANEDQSSPPSTANDASTADGPLLLGEAVPLEDCTALDENGALVAQPPKGAGAAQSQAANPK